MLFNVILLNLMKLMNNNRSVEGLELLWYLTHISHGVPGVWSTTPRNSETFPELIDFVELWILLSFLIERVQFSCLGSAMTKCLFSATHKIILNSCRVTLLHWIDNFCDFEIRTLQILVCWTYFLLFQNFTEEQFKTYKVSCYVKTLNQSMRCLNFKIIKVNCDELTTAILSRGIPRTRVLTHSTTISATCLMSKHIDEMYNISSPTEIIYDMIHHVGSRPQHGQAESGAGGVLQHVLHLRSGTKHRSVLWQRGEGGRDSGKMSTR